MVDSVLGDVYQHMTTPQLSLMWLRVNDGQGQPIWQPVPAGYQRGDGRRLMLTLSRREPIWVTQSYYERSTSFA